MVPIIDFSEEMIQKWIQKYVEQVVASGQLNSVAISKLQLMHHWCQEAIQLSSQHKAIFGGAALDHLRKLDSDAANIESEKSFATFMELEGIAKVQEIKVALVTMQHALPGMPQKVLLCAHDCRERTNNQTSIPMFMM